MRYYPKSQIKPNLYTNGGEFILSSTKGDYKGYYYNISSGKSYSGKNPTDKPNILLILKTSLNTPKTNNDFNILTGLESPNLITTINYEDTSTYLNLSTNLITSERFIPLFNTTTPTQKDLNLGQFNRYFCKKTNELKYLEIDKETYDQLKAKDSKIAWDLYEPTSLLWVIKGNQETVFNTNKTSVFKIEQNQRWNGFSQYFKENYSKYYESSTISNLYTAGNEFTTKNGQNYIGFYHIHNGTIPMVGKNHINEFHETLIPFVKPKPLTQATSSVIIPTTPTPPTTSGGGGSYGGGGGSY